MSVRSTIICGYVRFKNISTAIKYFKYFCNKSQKHSRRGVTKIPENVVEFKSDRMLCLQLVV